MIATSSEEQLESIAETVIQDVEMINGDRSKVLAGRGWTGWFLLRRQQKERHLSSRHRTVISMMSDESSQV